LTKTRIEHYDVFRRCNEGCIIHIKNSKKVNGISVSFVTHWLVEINSF